MIKTAFINVYDKKGIVEFADGLRELGYDIYSSASTLKLFRRTDITAQPISEGEQILYPAINSVLNIGDAEELPKPHIVVANLYPLSKIIEQDNFTFEELPQYLDIGNCALLRSAARSFSDTIVICDPKDYKIILDALRDFGDISEDRKKRLAAKAYRYCAYYDASIAQYLSPSGSSVGDDEIVLSLKKISDLSCGENPHQRGALYSVSGDAPRRVAAAKILQGKRLNYNHYADIDLACDFIGEFQSAACAIIKHLHICRVAWGQSDIDVLRSAFHSDCHGGIAVFNRKISLKEAKEICSGRLEGIVSPEYSKDALSYLRLKKRLKIITVPSMLSGPGEFELSSVSGGILMEEKDIAKELKYKNATKRKPGSVEFNLLETAQKIAKYAKSYSAVFVQEYKTLGVSDRQINCLESIRSASEKIKENYPIIKHDSTIVLACDSSMDRECVNEAAKCGVTAIVQPGLNSAAENAQCVEICDEKGIAMLFTGIRHLKQ